jgi:hypothetical protein
MIDIDVRLSFNIVKSITPEKNLSPPPQSVKGARFIKAYTHTLTRLFTLTGLLASFLLTMGVVYTPIYPHFSAFLYVKDFTIVR